ncbi:condensation domain-containing protein [Polymorphospora sp. NPDC050346]|uniref:condensation domain-containing protein n=1 Tax=Polymorphospora sp. NPDC050346 TaxID=3155780 RepID=UPI0033C9F88A
MAGGVEVRRAPLGGAQQFEWWKLHTGSCNAITVSYRPDPPIPHRHAVTVLRDLVAAHEALRTTFRLDDAGSPVQVVHAAAEPAVRFCDDDSDAARDAFRRALAEPPFTAADTELVRFGVVRSGNRAVELLIVVSHAVFDGHSERLVLTGLAAACREMPADPAGQERPDTGTTGADTDPPPAGDVRPGGHQPADSALDERSGELAPGREAAERFWRDEVRRIPARLFVPLRPDVLQRYGASYRSAALPAALVLAARRHRTSPAVVYSALVHALLAIMSGAPATVVRDHFGGRTGREREVVGCYHCILPTTVDVSDRPTVGTLIERLRLRMLRVQSRYRLGQLTLREILAAEERRRGVAFASGTTVNFDHGPELTELQRRDDRELTGLLATAGELELGMGRNETRIDREGFDSYLMTTVDSGAMWVLASFNGMVFDPAQMRALLAGPERILRTHLDGPDLTLDQVAARLGADIGDPVRADLRPGEEPADARVDGDPGRPALAALRDAVARFNGLDDADPRHCYLAVGGRLLLVPAVLDRLAADGWSGLVPDDFATPQPLTRLAGRLRRVG